MSSSVVVETLETTYTVEESAATTIDVEVLEQPFTVTTTATQIAQIEVLTAGPQGAQGAKGDPGSSATSQYTHTQAIPSTRWAVHHNLQRMPTAIRCWEQSTGDEVEPEVEDPATSDDPLNIVYLDFAQAMVGIARVS